MDQLRLNKGNTLEICFGLFIFLLILCLPNVSKTFHHDTGSYRLFVQQKGVLASIDWENVVSDHGAATA